MGRSLKTRCSPIKTPFAKMKTILSLLIALLITGMTGNLLRASIIFQEGFGRGSGSPLNGSSPNIANPFNLTWNADSHDPGNYANGSVSLSSETRWVVAHSPTFPNRGSLLTYADYASLNTTARIDFVPFKSDHTYYLWARVETFNKPENTSPHTAAIGFSLLNSIGKYHPMSASGGGIGYIYLDSLGNIQPKIRQGSPANLSSASGIAISSNFLFTALISVKATISNGQLIFEYFHGTWSQSGWENDWQSVPADASWFDPRFSWVSLGTATTSIQPQSMTAVTVGSAMDVYSAGTWPAWEIISLEEFPNSNPVCILDRISPNQISITFSGFLYESNNCSIWTKVDPQPSSPYILSIYSAPRKFFRAANQ